VTCCNAIWFSLECLLLQSFIEVWGEGASWNELLASVKALPAGRIDPWNSPDISFKIVVDGWGKAIKQAEQLSIVNMFHFLNLKVPPASYA